MADQLDNQSLFYWYTFPDIFIVLEEKVIQIQLLIKTRSSKAFNSFSLKTLIVLNIIFSLCESLIILIYIIIK